MTGQVSRADIEAAIKAATGDPSSGAIRDWTPTIAEAIDKLINGEPAPKETRVVKAAETRQAEPDSK